MIELPQVNQILGDLPQEYYDIRPAQKGECVSLVDRFLVDPNPSHVGSSLM